MNGQENSNGKGPRICPPGYGPPLADDGGSAPALGRRSLGEGSPAEKPARFAIFLSALVFPGTGQFTQRRPLAGSIYAVGFLACFMLTLVFAGGILVRYYRLAFDTAASPEADAGSLREMVLGMVFFFVMLLVVYVANILDVYLAYRRQSRASVIHEQNGLTRRGTQRQN